MFVKNKKGLSNIVTTVLIILIAIGAIAVMGFFVYQFVLDAQEGAQYDLILNQIQFSITRAEFDLTTKEIEVIVAREDGGDDELENAIIFPVLVFHNQSGETVSSKAFNNTNFLVDDSRRLTLPLNDHGLEKIIKVEVIPAILDSEGDTREGQAATDTYILAVCGNGWQEVTEECDDGNTNSNDGCSSICEIEMRIISSSPSNGDIDARQPEDVNGLNPDGWNEVNITFNSDPSSLGSSDFSITTINGGATPTVQSIDKVSPTLGANEVRLILSDRIIPGDRTVITLLSSGQTICLIYHPADVNGDGTSAAEDVTALQDHVADPITNPLPIHRSDIIRDELINIYDWERVIDLLAGGGVSDDVWLDVTIPGNCP